LHSILLYQIICIFNNVQPCRGGTEACGSAYMVSFRFFRLDEKKRFMLGLIGPAVAVLVFFQILPILTGANASFRDWHLHDPQKTWIGLTNYLYVLRDNEFLWIVLPNTFGFM